MLTRSNECTFVSHLGEICDPRKPAHDTNSCLLLAGIRHWRNCSRDTDVLEDTEWSTRVSGLICTRDNSALCAYAEIIRHQTSLELRKMVVVDNRERARSSAG